MALSLINAASQGGVPAFSAYQSSAQTLTSGSNILLQFQTKEFDTASAFNNTGSTVGGIPAYAFQPTVAGYYQVSGGFAVTATLQWINTFIFKNGSLFKIVYNSYTASVNAGYGSALVYLNGTTDYIQLYAQVGTGAALDARSIATYFQAVLVRSA